MVKLLKAKLNRGGMDLAHAGTCVSDMRTKESTSHEWGARVYEGHGVTGSVRFHGVTGSVRFGLAWFFPHRGWILVGFDGSACLLRVGYRVGPACSSSTYYAV